ncbi:MAG: hypothetical protein LBC64_04610 [Fibromonadaceae bacterium]|nr:hypothetical protein [Fibromonadaceae bacterium]
MTHSLKNTTFAADPLTQALRTIYTPTIPPYAATAQNATRTLAAASICRLANNCPPPPPLNAYFLGSVGRQLLASSEFHSSQTIGENR